MGKRKRRADRNKTPPSPGLAFASQTSQMESSLKEKSSHSIGSTGAKSTSSSLMNNVERSPPGHHQSAAHHRHHNANRTFVAKVPRHYYSLQHSQQKGGNHSATSNSHGKNADKFSWKFGHRPESGYGYHSGKKDKGSRRVDRIRSNTLVINAITPNVISVDCGLCRQRMSENSVVAVLVCGHFFHADCLETRTRNEDRRDPPCPLCMPFGVHH